MIRSCHRTGSRLDRDHAFLISHEADWPNTVAHVVVLGRASCGFSCFDSFKPSLEVASSFSEPALAYRTFRALIASPSASILGSERAHMREYGAFYTNGCLLASHFSFL